MLIFYINNTFFLNIYMHVCIFIYKIIIHSTHTYSILYKHKLLFCMRLIVFNHCPALINSTL